MTKGMKEFIIRVKDIQVEKGQSEYFQDIFREIECEMLLFVALRTLLGSDNNEGSRFDW